MSNDLATIFAGFDRCEGHVLDVAGVIAGTAVAGPATGAAGSPGFRLLGIKDAANIGVPDPVDTPITGDDHYIGTFLYPSAAARKFTLTAAVQGLDINQILGNGNAMAIGNSEVGFYDNVPFAPVNVALIVTSQSKSAQGSNVGLGLWGGYILPQIQIVPLGRQTLQERAAGIMRFGVIESQGAAYPWGETFQQGVHGITQAVEIAWTANNRKAMHRFTGDGATTIFGPLLYPPATTSLNDVVVYKNGYRLTAGVTVNIAAQTLTFAPAPANNDKIAVYYDHT